MVRRYLQKRRFMREHRWTHQHLSDYVDHDLPETQRRRVEEHTGMCPECRRVLASLRKTISALGSLRAEPRPAVADGVIERLRDDG